MLVAWLPALPCESLMRSATQATQQQAQAAAELKALVDKQSAEGECLSHACVRPMCALFARSHSMHES